MSSSEDRDIEPFDLFNRFFGSSRRSSRGGFFGFSDIFRGFEEMLNHHSVVVEQEAFSLFSLSPILIAKII